MGKKKVKRLFFFFYDHKETNRLPIRTIKYWHGTSEDGEQGTPWHTLADRSIRAAETVPKPWRGTSVDPIVEEEEEEDHRGVTAAVSLTLLVGKILGTLETKYWLSWPWRQASFSFTTFLLIVAIEDPISDKPTERVLYKLSGSASSFLQLLSREAPVSSVHISPDPPSLTSTCWSPATASPGLASKAPQLPPYPLKGDPCTTLAVCFQICTVYPLGKVERSKLWSWMCSTQGL